MSRPTGFHHTKETKLKMSQSSLGRLNSMYGISLSGKLNGNWKGGRVKVAQGYILVYKPEHPHSNSLGYVSEHRLVLEKKLGRYLLPSEVSHHLNGIRDDNRSENLVIYDNHSLHMKNHAMRRKIVRWT